MNGNNYQNNVIETNGQVMDTSVYSQSDVNQAEFMEAESIQQQNQSSSSSTGTAANTNDTGIGSDNSSSTSADTAASGGTQFHEQLLQDIINELHVSDDIDVDPYAMEVITNVISLKLSKYAISPICTDLAIRDTSFDRVLKIFCGSMITEGKSKRTVYTYRCVLSKFMADVNKHLEDVNVFDIRVWLAVKQNEVSMSTCENYRSYLSSFFGWLTREEFIEKNPMVKIKPIKFTKPAKHSFTEVEIDKLRMACKSLRERAIMEFLLSSGIRISELSDLHRSDVNMETKEVNVRHGKGGKQRFTYINDVCRTHLSAYLDSRADSNETMFLSNKNNPMSPGAARLMLHKLAIRAGMKEEDVHPHRFRRTFATKHAKDGMTMTSIQKLMGHSQINTTQLYIDMNSDTIKQEYERFA